MEEYMIIEPNGAIRWIQTERENMLDTFHAAIGCDCLENVRTIVRDVCLIVDESGKVKANPQPHNERASRLYWGYLAGKDDIVGPAIVAAIHLVDGDPDWVPLNLVERLRVSSLGIYPRERVTRNEIGHLHPGRQGNKPASWLIQNVDRCRILLEPAAGQHPGQADIR